MQRHLPLALVALLGCSSASVNHGGPGQGNGGQGGASGRDSGNGNGSGGELLLGGDGSLIVGRDGGHGVPGSTCAGAKAAVEPIPLDIALLVDTSYSMDFNFRWQYVRGALTSFVDAPGQGELGLALQFFPLRAQCDIAAYAAPAFPMASVATARVGIEQTLDARKMSGGTPLVQVLQGMGQYAAKWATDHPTHKTVIVVATDGVPDATCSAMSLTPPNDLPNAVKTAKALATGTPALPIFVIGVGAELDALNTIADAGGTGSAVLISDGADAEKQFLDALRNIRQSSLGCDYLVPDNSAGAIDFNTVNVNYTEGTRSSTFYYVADAAGCNLKPDQSWYYDDPKAPTKVVLCPHTCDIVAKAATAKIDIEYGCKQRVVQ